MNAPTHTTDIGQSPATEAANQNALERPLLTGFLMSECGILLISLGGWVALNAMTQTLLLLCGGVLCFFGIVLIPPWISYRTTSGFLTGEDQD